MSYDALEEILRLAAATFSLKPCTEEEINKFLNRVPDLIEDSGRSREDIFEEITRRFNVSIVGEDVILDDKGNHIDWFNPATGVGLKRDIEWHFWDHFKQYLRYAKGWPGSVIENVDSETNKILSRLEDPCREGQWDRRGMVIGSVQSGKTGNYTGLIAKAIDAGYKLIVVITGVHNSLRSQTQFRLNEELLGYHLDKVEEYSEHAKIAGVRKLCPDHRIINTLTNSSDDGDFRRKIAEQAGIAPSKNGDPIILVIKKHVSILKNLIEWSTAIVGKKDSKGRVVVEDIPLLLIDDECDYASVNTNTVRTDENGRVDPECDPSQTNRRIRELLAAFQKSVYVGYTATPYANIFIHHDQVHDEYGQDIFPRNFIISLPQPSNYVGPSRVFGLNEHEAAGITAKEPLPLLRYVDDADSIFPPSHKKTLGIARLPKTLKDAIKSFLIVCAIRRHRRCQSPHNTMLIHVTRFTDVQQQVKDLVERELRRLVNLIRAGTGLEEFKSIWADDFSITTGKMSEEFGCSNLTWQEVVENLYPVARRIEVKSINGCSDESLDYRRRELDVQKRFAKKEEVSWEEQGENVISIGGDKLSRGLTLDGLTVSYYLRSSKMYDTLMQMGRWFGYRDGYEDLCRIYTTQSLCDWYRFIATATLELLNELKYMELRRLEPRAFGLKVQAHPGQLAITGAGKRRNTEQLKLSYSGTLSQTVVFDQGESANNKRALETLVSIADEEVDAVMPPKRGSTVVWRGIGSQAIVDFLDSYRTDREAAVVVDTTRIAQFIKKQIQNGRNDLTSWTLAIISVKKKKAGSCKVSVGGREFICSERAPTKEGPVGDIFSISALVSPDDERLDFSEEEKARFDEKVTNREIRGIRPKNRGLLLVYPICCLDPKSPYGLDPEKPVFGVAISWPDSDTTIQVQYAVNSVYQDAED